jgi:hypothetical protein
MYTPVKLDKMRNFRYGMKALDRIEKTLNIRMSKLNLEELSQHELSVIIWAGLVHEDAALTPDIVMDLVDEHSSIPAISEEMSKAFEAAFGSGEAGKKGTKVPKN